MSTAEADAPAQEFDDATKALGDQIVKLTLLEAAGCGLPEAGTQY